ncbi:MAG: ethanolamine ammonia-lyase subunit EutC [Afipia sp.]|nr:ethanolamine ammonia-lyase subunit EutC [Afipia sp.]
MTNDNVTKSPWTEWRGVTPARLALGRSGSGMPTDEVLKFGWAHAMARDAIHAALDVEKLDRELNAQGWATAHVQSRARDRAIYLRRPDLGRVIDPDDIAKLRAAPFEPSDICIVIGDGLSALAIKRHAAPLLAALKKHLANELKNAPVVVATQARVALGDEIAELLRAKLSIVLIGERPGLSSPDSLGIYLTHAPFKARSDADRNCISNVRLEGLSYDAAAFKLAWLVRAALGRGITGVDLKDESDLALIVAKTKPVLPNN